MFATISVWPHSRGIWLFRYLDDWLILASSEDELNQHVRELVSLCHSLGIVINDEKSDLVPKQRGKYLGMVIDTVAARIFPTPSRVEKFWPWCRSSSQLWRLQHTSGRSFSATWRRWRSSFHKDVSGCAPFSGS